MKRFYLIKPPAGWPSFITELAIVILGVLIALGAQQAVDDWGARRNVAAFRQAVDSELAENLSAYEQRILQTPCIVARLDQLEAWQREWRDGHGPAMLGRVRRPIGMTLRRDVWDTGALSIIGEMALDQRLAYGALYSDLQSYDNLRLREAAVWQELYGYDQADRLTPPEVNRLRGLILSARSLDWSISGNWPPFKQEAAKLGLKPAKYVPEPAAQRLCETIEFR